MPASRRRAPAGPGRGPGRRDARRSTRAPTRPRWPTGCGPLAGHRALDGRLHRHAGPRRPRRLHRRPTSAVRRAARPAGRARRPRRRARALAERWRPWRAYATVHLWAVRTDTADPSRSSQGARTRCQATTTQRKARRMSRRPGRRQHGRHRPTEHGPSGRSWSTARSARWRWSGDDDALTHLFLPNTGQAGRRRLAGTGARGRSPGGRQLDQYFAGAAPTSTSRCARRGRPFQRQRLADPGRHPLRHRPSATPSWPGGWAGPRAFRAVGQANGANPLPIFCPATG